MKNSKIEIPPYLVFPVRKVPSMDVNPGYASNTYNSHSIITETPRGIVKVNECSDEYSLIRNEAVIMPLISELSKTHGIMIKGQAWQDALFSIQIAIDKSIEPLEVDKLYPMINIMNSYNGRVKCTITMGIWRAICKNGLMVPEMLTHNKSFSHTPLNEESIAVTQIIQVFESFLYNVGDVMGAYDDLKASPVFMPENRVDEVLEATSFPVSRKDEVLDRINLEHAKHNLKLTDWLVYNGFNYQLNHAEDLVWDPKKRLKVDREVLNYLLEN